MKKFIKNFSIILFLVLFLNTKFSVFAKQIIPEDAVEFNNHSYKLYELNMTWEDAQEYFKDNGGHLATITSQEENDFLFNYIISQSCDSAYFGATDKENEGNWIWITGEEFIYSNWHNNEPNNERGDENYAMFYYKYPDGTWNDGVIRTYSNDLPYSFFICEWDNTTQNEFTTNCDQKITDKDNKLETSNRTSANNTQVSTNNSNNEHITNIYNINFNNNINIALFSLLSVTFFSVTLKIRNLLKERRKKK